MTNSRTLVPTSWSAHEKLRLCGASAFWPMLAYRAVTRTVSRLPRGACGQTDSRWIAASMSVIFISYRRDDSQGFAGRLEDDLSECFGEERVFRDREIPVGTDFAQHLEGTLGAAAVLLAVIGPNWLEVRGADGRRRLDDPGTGCAGKSRPDSPGPRGGPRAGRRARMPRQRRCRLRLRRWQGGRPSCSRTGAGARNSRSWQGNWRGSRPSFPGEARSRCPGQDGSMRWRFCAMCSRGARWRHRKGLRRESGAGCSERCGGCWCWRSRLRSSWCWSEPMAIRAPIASSTMSSP